jgi:hypothetical protein
MFSTEYRGQIGAIGASEAHNSAKNSAKLCILVETVVGQSPNDRTASGNLVVDRTGKGIRSTESRFPIPIPISAGNPKSMSDLA